MFEKTGMETVKYIIQYNIRKMKISVWEHNKALLLNALHGLANLIFTSIL